MANEIKGYDKLSTPAQRHFDKVLAKHHEVVGHVEVYFSNGEWNHYWVDSTWS